MTTPPVAARTRLRRTTPILLVAVLAWLTPIAAAAQTMDHDAAPATHPEVVVHAFGSVDWASAGEPGEANSFGLGQLALFMTSAINDRVSVLAEIVLEASAANTQVTTDLERLQLTHRLNDHLHLSAGTY